MEVEEALVLGSALCNLEHLIGISGLCFLSSQVEGMCTGAYWSVLVEKAMYRDKSGHSYMEHFLHVENRQGLGIRFHWHFRVN